MDQRVSTYEIRQRLAELDVLLSALGADLDVMRNVQAIEDKRVVGAVREALTAVGQLRSMVAQAAQKAGMDAASWTTRLELDAILAQFEARLSREGTLRQRLSDLAEALSRGRVAHRSPQRARLLEGMRVAAATQLREKAAGETVPELPGSGDGNAWIEWALSLEGQAFDDLLTRLQEDLDRLAEFIADMDLRNWSAGEDSVPEPVQTSASEVHNDVVPPVDAGPVEPEPAPAAQEVVVESPRPPTPTDEPADAAPEVAQVPAAIPAAGQPEMATVPLQSDPGAAQDDGPTATTEPLTDVALSLPVELQTFAAFADRHWIGPDGQAQAAPWKEPAFMERLRDAETQAVSGYDFARWWLLCKAAESVGRKLTLTSRDISALAAVWDAPASPSAGYDEDRPASLREMAGDSAGMRLRLVLEALRTSRKSPLQRDETGRMVELAQFANGGLAKVVHALLDLGAMGFDGVDLLRGALGKRAAPTLEQLKQNLQRKRQEFHREMVKRWQAAGGQIERTHCRRAWDDFILRVRDDLQVMYPEDKRGKPDWDTTRMEGFLRTLDGVHAEIADRAGARLKDREKMNGAVRFLVDLALSVNEAMRQVQRFRPVTDDSLTRGLPVREASALRERMEALNSPGEELCRQLILRCLEDPTKAGFPPRASDSLSLRVRDVLAAPGLLEMLDPSTIRTLADAQDGDMMLLRVDVLEDPLRAVSLLCLAAPKDTEPDQNERPIDTLSRQLEARERWDLLKALSPALDSRQQKRLQDHASRNEEECAEIEGALRRHWLTLEEIPAVPMALQLREILKSHEVEPKGEVHEPRMRAAWLRRVRQESERAVRALEVRARERAEGLPSGTRERALSLISKGHLAEALGVLRDRTTGFPAEPTRLRETRWRDEAERDGLSLPAVLKGLGDGAEDFASLWNPGVCGKPTKEGQRLRTAFRSLVLTAIDDSRARSGANELRIDIGSIRKALAPHNPTFLPQLAHYAEIVILTPAGRDPDHSYFVSNSVKQVSAYPTSLVVLLAPGLGRRRTELLVAFQRHVETTAVVLDDLDMARVLDPDRVQDRLVALVEIALSQHQDPLRHSPFGTQDGQFVSPEMFVGRRTQAEDLALKNRYTRVFSGRRLGKSALLRFVQQKYDGSPLPSGNILRVLFVGAAGAESEVSVVDLILREMARQLSFTPGARDVSKDPGGALRDAFQGYLDVHTGESLLVVLDEADLFIEDQLRLYEQNREKCLSFLMRSSISNAADSMGLPRVRFVFAGYRAANTNGGVWANWGEVLTLDPLPLKDARDLVAGPLARLGVDAADRAEAIARRCGCQPAVLLRFGDQCLRYLVRTGRFASGRTPLTVDDVAEVYHGREVEDEIRRIIQNNFQGVSRGYIVFRALVLELAQAGRDGGIEDADVRIIDRLRSIDSNLDWLESDGRKASAEVQRLLREFVARQLVVENRIAGVVHHGLRFPHHLSILMRADLDDEVRRDIAAERAAIAASRSGVPWSGPRSLLQPIDLELLRDLVTHPPEHLDVRLALVASLWPEGVDHRLGGIADRLGFDAHSVLEARRVNTKAINDREDLALAGIDPELAEKVLASRPPQRRVPLLTGGADLLRWGLERRCGASAESAHVASLGRLTSGILDWWFRSVRGVELYALDAIPKIYEATGGIPFLVRSLDRLVEEQHIESLDSTGLAKLLKDSKNHARSEARLLVTGAPAWRLLPREIEILKMAMTAAIKSGSDSVDLSEELVGEEWEEFFAEHLPVAPLGPGDGAAIRVLTELGFLPTNTTRPGADEIRRLGTLSRSDPLVEIVAWIEESS